MSVSDQIRCTRHHLPKIEKITLSTLSKCLSVGNDFLAAGKVVPLSLAAETRNDLRAKFRIIEGNLFKEQFIYI